jgi:hypothetical protein
MKLLTIHKGIRTFLTKPAFGVYHSDNQIVAIYLYEKIIPGVTFIVNKVTRIELIL